MKAAWAAAVIAFGVRMGVAVALHGFTHPYVDEYTSMARALLAGQGLIYVHNDVLYRSYAPPMQAWLTAASLWASGGMALLMLWQIVAGSALAAVTCRVADRVFSSPLAGLAAGLLVAVHPGLAVYSASKAHPLTMDALFFALALLQTVRVAERPTLRRAVVLGLVIGTGALSRATIVIFLPVIGLWLLTRTPWRQWLMPVRLSLVAGLCAAAVIAPWTIRNSVIHHRFVFMLTTDAEDFWRGNNPWATGHSYAASGRTIMETIPPAMLQEIKSQPGELAQAEWYRAHARQWVRDNPGAFVRLAALKFYHFWWFAPETGVLYPRLWLLVYKLFYAAIVVLAIVGVMTVPRTRKATEQLVVLIGFLLALSALQSAFYVETRHRWAVEPMLLVLSGGGVAAIARRWGTEPQPQPVDAR